MSLYRCSACGSANVMVEQEKEGYSFAKGAAGVAVLGVGGAVAGINGKSKKVYKCPDCGLTMNNPMPFELQTLIEIGVMDAKARDNLMLAGVKIEWQELKNRYKNIETGFADNQVVESKVFVEEKPVAEKNMLEFCARATKEEFDWAEDILNSNSYEKIKSKEEYLDFVYASGMYIENLFKYKPDEFSDDIKRAICDSIVFSFYDARKELISGGYVDLDAFFKKEINDSPFYRQLVKTFLDSDDNFLYASISYGGRICKNFQWRDKENIVEDFYYQILMPPLLLRDDKLMRAINIDGKYIEIDEFIDRYKEEGKEITAWLSMHSQRKQRFKQLCDKYPQNAIESMIETRKSQLSSMQNKRKQKEEELKQIELKKEKLENRKLIKTLFFKRIDNLNRNISQLHNAIKKLEEEENLFLRNVEMIQEERAEKNRLKAWCHEESEKEFRKLCKKFSYFIVWEEVKE